MDYSYEVAKAIQEERLREAERMRMLKQAEAARPDFQGIPRIVTCGTRSPRP